MSESFEQQQATGMCPHGNFPSHCETCRSYDLRDLVTISRILVSGSEEEMRALQIEHKLTPEQMSWLRADERLRSSVHQASDTAFEQRLKENPEPTQRELALGVFLEHIEPQVRDAVITLHEKGYSTWESGFMGSGEQRISFTGEPLAGFKAPQELIDRLRQSGIELTIESDSISMETSIALATPTLEQWTQAWSDVMNVVPDLGIPAQPSKYSENFRARYLKE